MAGAVMSSTYKQLTGVRYATAIQDLVNNIIRYRFEGH